MHNSFLPGAIAGLCWLAAGLGAFCAAAENRPFELKEGDRVVFLGNRLIERAQDYGYLEAALASRWPGRKISSPMAPMPRTRTKRPRNSLRT